MSSRTTLLTVTDLHRSAGLLRALNEVVARHKPDMVALLGDFLHAFDDNEGRMTVEDCARLLSKMPCAEIAFVRGNHEDEAWGLFAEAWNKSGRPLHALHGEVFSRGPLTIVGFPCHMGDETAFLGDREPLAYDRLRRVRPTRVQFLLCLRALRSCQFSFVVFHFHQTVIDLML